jgi:AP endonuclease-1
VCRIPSTLMSWIREKRDKSYRCFVDELQRCEDLGLTLYNFQSVVFSTVLSSDVADAHCSSPGSTVGACTVDESLGHIADCINSAHKETKGVITVIENMVRACSPRNCSK